MPEPNPTDGNDLAGQLSRLTSDQLLVIDRVCLEYEQTALKEDGLLTRLLESCKESPEVFHRALYELLLLEWKETQSQGKPILFETYKADFEVHSKIVQLAIAEWTRLQSENQNADSPKLAHDPSSHGKELIEWIRSYQEALAKDPTLNPTDWLSHIANPTQQLTQAIAGLEFIRKCGAESESEGIGKQIGDFRLGREIGRGGMGVVYEAEQISLGRTVALKILWFGPISDGEAIRRFQREASTVAKLHHTNIVPIFSVGSEGPINYYAMQLIEGQSLDRVAKQANKSLDWTKIAEWGLQAAEALEHAHRRSVIHRDVKPSNLLLDEEGRIWLTDFGLAKRTDDVTLSMAGAMLGTPRYMSPEQASASTGKVDHRSDVYSLGATLYELVTGHPVFEADTPHGILSQILSSSPVPAVQWLPSLPRDFNTILMKCLSKKAEDRYATAQDLANDLRALLDGRAIHAKRPSLLQLSKHWIRKHKREVGWSAASIVATFLIFALSAIGFYGWKTLNETQVSFKSDVPSTVVELRNDKGDRIAGPITTPTPEPLVIPSGISRLVLSAPGYLSQEYSTDLPPGDSKKWDLSPKKQVIETLPFPGKMVSSKRGAIKVYRSNDNEIRFDFFTGDSVFTLWKDLLDPNRNNDATSRSDNGRNPTLFPESFDWNADGKEDILLGMHDDAALRLISLDGKVQWRCTLSQSEPRIDNSGLTNETIRSAIAGIPYRAGDVDEDGAEDIVVDYVDNVTELRALEMVRSLALVSGRNGAVIWRYCDPTSMKHAPVSLINETPPLPGYEFNYGANLSFSYSMFDGKLKRFAVDYNFEKPPQIGAVIDVSPTKNRLVYLAGTQLLQLDLKSGQPKMPPLDLKIGPSTMPKVADLDGIAGDEVVIAERYGGPPNSFISPSPAKKEIRVYSVSLDDNSVKWEKILSARSPIFGGANCEKANWPLVLDLDGDGKSEVITPDDSMIDGSVTKGGAIKLLSGVDGGEVWSCYIPNVDTQVDHFLPCSDQDSDGVRDLLAVTLGGKDLRLYVDCISGKDGAKLWFVSADLPIKSDSLYPGKPWLWKSDSDGDEQLVIPSFTSESNQEHIQLGHATIISLRDRKVAHQINGLHRLSAIDFNGDRLDDLAVTRPSYDAERSSTTFSTSVFSNDSKVMWQRIGTKLEGVDDLDGDQIPDLIEVAHRRVTAISSRSGSKLWSYSVEPLTSKTTPHHAHSSTPSPIVVHKPNKEWDFNGDGINDILLAHSGSGFPFQPMEAISGKTGKRLWKCAEVLRYGNGGVADVRDLDGDGVSEVVWYGFRDSQLEKMGNRKMFSGNSGHLMISVFSSGNGSVLWQRPMNEDLRSIPGFSFDSGALPPLQFRDVDGNGTTDILAVAVGELTNGSFSTVELRALDGKSGTEIWKRVSTANSSPNSILEGAPVSAQPLANDSFINEFVFSEIATDWNHAHKIVKWDSKTGSEVWSRTIAGSKEKPLSENFSDRSVPYFLKRKTEKPWIAFACRCDDGINLYVWDAEGNPKGKETFGDNSDYEPCRLSVTDYDHDGNQDIVVAEKGIHLFQVDESLKKVVHHDNDITFDDIFASCIDSSKSGLQLVVHHGLGVSGYDPVRGTHNWTWSKKLSSEMSLWSQDSSLPIIVSQSGNQAVCERPVILNSDFSKFENRRIAVQPRTIKLDPRLLRPLPWSELVLEQGETHLSPTMRGLFWDTIFLGLLPCLLAWHLLKQRTFQLLAWSLLPVVCALFISRCLFADFGRIRSMSERIGLAIYLTPALAFIFLTVRLTLRRKWKWLLASGITTIVATIFCVLYGLRSEILSRPLMDGEVFSMQRWYLVLLEGYFLMTWIIAISYLIAPFFRWMRGMRREKIRNSK